MAQLLYIIASLHVLLCPFTKVEESFNIQAFHDILYHRHNLSQYDHNEFPGVVPRSFIGPLVISIASAPVAGLLHLCGINKFWMQYIVRLTLALSVIGAWARLRNTLQKQFGSTYTWWFTLITITQYHFMFYLSRPLPNIMVLPLVLLAFEGWLSGRHKQFLISAGAGIIIFRAELAMLFGLFLIIDLYFKKIDIVPLLKTVIPAGIGLIAFTFIVDSIFWGRPLWPEAEVFWYNTVMNKSSNWGTSPFLWYFYSALPRGLGPSLILIPVGVYLDKRTTVFAAPAIVYIFLYSFLPHKELRFIIYVFPLLNMTSAAACSYIFIRRTKAPIYELLFWGTIVVLLGNVVLSLAFVSVAMANYPGGVAITRFHKLLRNEPFVHLHIDNLAAQTGVTRFTQYNDHWIYSKNESLQPYQLQKYTHLLIEAKSKYSSNLKSFSNTHVIVESIESFSQISINYKLIPPVKIKTKPSIFILERKDFREFPEGHTIIRVTEDYEYIDEQDVDSAQFSNEESALNLPANEVTTNEFDTMSVVSNEVDIIDIENLSPQLNDMADQNNDEKNDGSSANDASVQDITKAKKALDELKNLRQEKKQKAIAKIKSETRKEVVASAKEKLKEIMKRHQHIAEEFSEVIISDVNTDMGNELDDNKANTNEIVLDAEDLTLENDTIYTMDTQGPEDIIIEPIQAINQTDENLNAIVEEVIARLIDRKIYDDKTKPEDIRAEDRKLIQQIVEEVVAERMNYTSPNNT